MTRLLPLLLAVPLGLATIGAGLVAWLSRQHPDPDEDAAQ